MKYHGGDIYGLQNETVDFSVNINPLGVPESFRRAILEHMDEFSRYPDTSYGKLKENIGAYLGVSKDFIMPGNGAVDVIYRTVRALKPQKAVILSPAFSEYRGALEEEEIPFEECVLYDFDRGAFFLDRIERIEENTLYIHCNPNNPTGFLTPKGEILAFLERLKKQQSYLLLDECFMDFAAGEESLLDRVEDYQNLILVQAATKFFGLPGVRLGYGVAADRTLRERINQNTEPWMVNTAAVIAAGAVFSDREYIERSRKWIKEEQPYMAELLGRINGIHVYPSSANFFLAEVTKKGLDAYRLKERLLERGYYIRNPEGFYGLGDTFFRIAVKGRGDNTGIALAIEEVLKEI